MIGEMMDWKMVFKRIDGQKEEWIDGRIDSQKKEVSQREEIEWSYTATTF